MSYFVGRAKELHRLRECVDKKVASFVVVKGRRRIGKSRLLKEFAKHFDHFYSFVGLSPTKKTTHLQQLNEFSKQTARTFRTVPARYDDWSDALWNVGERVQKGKTLLVFDEISWMGSKDSLFLSKIKNFWDEQLKKNHQLVFVVCGSASAWIEKNILSHTGFVGRISLTLTLTELPLIDCNRFWSKLISAYEKFKILSVTGGIPRYLEEIYPKQTAEENIKKLCFTKGGLLVNEFEQIFSHIFLRKSPYYKRIIAALADGAKETNELCASLGITRHGRIPEYLWELEQAGFIARDHTWHLKTGKDIAISKYRLCDNYLRFYIKYIEPNLGKINRNAFALTSLGNLPQWQSMMGLQFENIILNNRPLLHAALHIKPEDIICENPFYQRKTNLHPGCQIDYMIQTKFDTLYICEIKFSKEPIGSFILEEVRTKIKALHYGKRFSCRPVLIHVNGVAPDVQESDFFAAIIDMGKLVGFEPEY